MNRPMLYIAGLAVATFASVANLYIDSDAALPYKAYKAQQSVVKVVSLNIDPETGGLRPTGMGSGVLVRPGAILTCAHVTPGLVAGVEYQDGTKELGTVYRLVKGLDLAIVRVKHPSGRIAPLGRLPLVGEPVLVVGNPIGLSWVVTSGIISALEDRGLISNAVVNPGSSGGGVFNSRLELVGIVQAMVGPTKERSFQGYSLFIPRDKIRAIMNKYDRLLKEGELDE